MDADLSGSSAGFGGDQDLRFTEKEWNVSTAPLAMTRRRDALKRSGETLRRSIDELNRQLSGPDATVQSPISLRRRKAGP